MSLFRLIVILTIQYFAFNFLSAQSKDDLKEELLELYRNQEQAILVEKENAKTDVKEMRDQAKQKREEASQRRTQANRLRSEAERILSNADSMDENADKLDETANDIDSSADNVENNLEIEKALDKVAERIKELEK